MFVKPFLIAVLAVGTLAQFHVSESDLNHVKDNFIQYCRINAAEDEIAAVQTSVTDFADCIKVIFNVDTLKEEIEEAKKTGALDEVFKNYCDKSTQLKTCFHNVVAGVTPCLDSNTRGKTGIVNNATDLLIDFACHKDGDRIALFIAEDGPQCFQQKANDLRECARTFQGNVKTLNQAKAVAVNEQCTKYDELTTCVVNSLEQCESPTPSNMAESVLRFLRRNSPCPEID